MILDIFSTNKYDNEIAIIDNNKSYTYLDLKQIIQANIELIKNKNQNVIINQKNGLLFFIQFFASIFSNKNIYLVSDKNKLKNINFDYYIFEKVLFDKKEFQYFEIDINLPLVHFYTSGTSGKPKVIKKSLFNLIKEAEDISKEFNFKNLNVITTSTMCHLFPLTFQLMVSLENKLIINTKEIMYPENVDLDNCILVSTPAFLNSIYKHFISFKTAPKYIISAGSKLDENVFKKLEENSKIIEIYGSTETGVMAYKTHFEDDFTIFKNVSLKSVNDYTEVESDYFFEDKISINDNVEIKDRHLKFNKRTDRLFKILEKRISAVELEEKLKEHDFINDCYILKIGEKLGCICALSENGKKFVIDNDVVKLIKELKNYLFKYFEIVPQKWRFIDVIPMNKTGKIDKEIINKIFNKNISLPIILDRKINQNEITYKIFFYKHCNFFKGHFPEINILPGVVQLYFAKELINYHFNLNVGQGQWKRIKFSNIIKANRIVYLKLLKDNDKVNYEYYDDNQKYSSGVFLCENIFKKAGL